MKKITLTVLMLFVIQIGFSQFSEDFNGAGAAFPPAGWTVFNGANGLGTAEVWEQAGADPEFRAQNIWEAVTPGQLAEDWIVTPLIPINMTQNVVQFDATDLNQGDFGSVLSIRVSTSSQTDTTSFTEVGSFTEAQLGNNASAVFSTFTVDLAAYMNQSVYIAFVHVQNDGDAVTFDNVAMIQGASAAPGPANTPTPADAATGVTVDLTNNDNSVTFDWQPDTSLGAVAPDEYEFFLGDSPTTLSSIGTIPAAAARPINVNGFFYNTTYYWQIVPRNTAGAATNNPIWSFTTEAGTITAPNPASAPTPADGATNVTIDTSNNNAVAFAWTPDATGSAAESYLFNFGTDPNALTTLGATANVAIDITGIMENTTYYWQIVPRNVGGEAANAPIWSFTTENTASLGDNPSISFTVSPNPATDILEISSENTISSIQIYTALGQLIKEDIEFTNNNINVRDLKSGIYVIKINTEFGSKAVQFIKE
ncbi:T9SS-dependent choice-of-anchor J family protein [Nonlabens tegetincola]|uniref:T9SS-dependent choice-of-anchor J family protein n=1 Tax=Nonlabens tegetincola TaxID=323273 RepID=UPI0030C80EB3